MIQRCFSDIDGFGVLAGEEPNNQTLATCGSDVEHGI